MDRFLDHLVWMLVSNSTFQHETALEVVCLFELHPSFYPDLLFELDDVELRKVEPGVLTQHFESQEYFGHFQSEWLGKNHLGCRWIS